MFVLNRVMRLCQTTNLWRRLLHKKTLCLRGERQTGSRLITAAKPEVLPHAHWAHRRWRLQEIWSQPPSPQILLEQGHIMTSVKLTFNLLGVKCYHFISSYYPTICVKLHGKWHMELRMTFDPVPPKSNHFITWFQETVSKKMNFVFMMWLSPAANTRSVKTTILFSWLTQLLFSQSTHCLENIMNWPTKKSDDWTTNFHRFFDVSVW